MPTNERLARLSSTRRRLTDGRSANQSIADTVENLLLEGVDFEHRPLWSPNEPIDGLPNPQELAVESLADELFYGGAAGGGKTDLLLGISFTRHKRSIIFRRIYPNLKAVIDRSEEIVGERGDYNRQTKRWRLLGRTIDFAAMQYEDDKKGYQGQPHDFYGFDEITEFTRAQYQFVIGWNRSADENQRCRVVVGGNPPTDESGSWVIEEWAPWLDPEFPDPAEPGELRWYYRDGERLVWTKVGDPLEVNEEIVYPRSRTFIPAKLSDNPHLSTDPRYVSVLQSLPEPLRSMFLYGDFSAAIDADPWQVIPTEWVQLAQKRWLERSGPDVPLSAVGVDCARGGKDKTVIAKRYGVFFVYKAHPGITTPNGPTVVLKVVEFLGDEIPMEAITVDVIGIGSSVYDSLDYAYEDRCEVYALNVSTGSDHRDRSGALKMRNKRAEMHWRLREALDPEHGDDLSLPPGNEVLADLCSARYKHTMGGILVEEKSSIIDRIGRSPDIGEAILMSLMKHPEPEKKKKVWIHRGS